MKQCKHPTCGEVCRRIKKPKKRFILKRTAIRKPHKSKAANIDKKLQREKDLLFYLEIWDERPHVDFETGDTILGEPLTLYMHHVLPKSLKRFKKFRYCKWNVILVSWNTHSLADNAMTFTPKIKAYYRYLIRHLDEIENETYIPSFKKFENENRKHC